MRKISFLTVIFVTFLLPGLVGCSQDANENEATIVSYTATPVEESTPIPQNETKPQLASYVVYSPDYWTSPAEAQTDIEPLLAQYNGLSIQEWITTTEQIETTFKPTKGYDLAFHGLSDTPGVLIMRQVPSAWPTVGGLEPETDVAESELIESISCIRIPYASISDVAESIDLYEFDSKEQIVDKLLSNPNIDPYCAQVTADYFLFHCMCVDCDGCPDPVGPAPIPPGINPQCDNCLKRCLEDGLTNGDCNCPAECKN
jgi:hypothetical protein